MFARELRFYREIAPEVGVRVPECYEADETGEGFRLVLEDLSSWTEGGGPVKVAVALKQIHQRWLWTAEQRWPWLKRDGRGALAVGELYDRVWSGMQGRPELTPVIRDLGDRFAGRVAALERLRRPDLVACLVRRSRALGRRHLRLRYRRVRVNRGLAERGCTRHPQPRGLRTGLGRGGQVGGADRGRRSTAFMTQFALRGWLSDLPDGAPPLWPRNSGLFCVTLRNKQLRG
jgi:hypothetical protein